MKLLFSTPLMVLVMVALLLWTLLTPSLAFIPMSIMVALAATRVLVNHRRWLALEKMRYDE